MHPTFPHLFMKLSRRGTTLVEIMVGIAILSVGLVLVIRTMHSTLRVQSIGAHQLIATNIAREGLEAMRNIRDTNWLVNSGHLRECWNYSRSYFEGIENGLPFVDPPGSRDIDAKIEAAKCQLPEDPFSSDGDINLYPIRSGYYAISQDLADTMGWYLTSFSALDPSNELRESGIDITSYIADADTAGAEQTSHEAYPFLLYQIQPSTSVADAFYSYVHDVPDTNALLSTEIKRPRYFRQIRVRYLCDEPTYDGGLGTFTEDTPLLNSDGYPEKTDTDCRTVDPTGTDYEHYVERDDNRMEVTSIVQWFEGGRVHEVRLMTHLVDWYQRDGHDG